MGSFVNKMGRPKKYKGDTEVVSFRIPKFMKSEIKKAVDDLINVGTAIVYKKGNLAKTIDPISETGVFLLEITKYEKELKGLDQTKGTFARQRIEFCKKKIEALKRQLPNQPT